MELRRRRGGGPPADGDAEEKQGPPSPPVRAEESLGRLGRLREWMGGEREATDVGWMAGGGLLPAQEARATARRPTGTPGRSRGRPRRRCAWKELWGDEGG